MTEGEQQQTEVDQVALLRQEYDNKFAELKNTFQKEMESRDKQIAEQQKHIDSLNSALVMHSTINPTPQAPPKTEAEIRAEETQNMVDYCKKLLIEHTY